MLNPTRTRLVSVYRNISRNGCKFGVGIGVVNQKVSEIGALVLNPLNTQITMISGSADEPLETILSSSVELNGFIEELQVLGCYQVSTSMSFRCVVLPIQAANYDANFRSSDGW